MKEKIENATWISLGRDVGQGGRADFYRCRASIAVFVFQILNLNQVNKLN